jgi:hypothetical protein
MTCNLTHKVTKKQVFSSFANKQYRRDGAKKGLQHMLLKDSALLSVNQLTTQLTQVNCVA